MVVSVKSTVLSGLSIAGALQVNASNVTVKNVNVVTNALYGIGLTHTTGVTIENSTVSGLNSTTGRVAYAIYDVYGDSTGMTIKANNVSNFRTGIQVSTGLVEGNFIHDPGFVAGDHTNGIYVRRHQVADYLWQHHLRQPGPDDAINLDAGTPGPSASVANKTITGNFLAGGPTPSTAAPPAAAPPRTSRSRTTGSARTTSPRAASTAPPTTSTPRAAATPGPATPGHQRAGHRLPATVTPHITDVDWPARARWVAPPGEAGLDLAVRRVLGHPGRQILEAKQKARDRKGPWPNSPG